MDLIQVCADVSEPATRVREVAALREAMAKTGLRHATMVTLTASDQVDLPEGQVSVVPAWRWFTADGVQES